MEQIENFKEQNETKNILESKTEFILDFMD